MLFNTILWVIEFGHIELCFKIIDFSLILFAKLAVIAPALAPEIIGAGE